MLTVTEALTGLNYRIDLADSIGQALDLAAGEAAPPWVWVFREQVQAIRDAAEALELAMNAREDVQ